jgi:hypothetical protein
VVFGERGMRRRLSLGESKHNYFSKKILVGRLSRVSAFAFWKTRRDSRIRFSEARPQPCAPAAEAAEFRIPEVILRPELPLRLIACFVT